MIAQEDDFDSELEQARNLLSRSLVRDPKMDDPDEQYRLRRRAGIVSGSADESNLGKRSGNDSTPPL